MTTTSQTPDRPAVPPLTRPEMGLAGVGALAAAGVGALGLISSFDAVSAAALRWGSVRRGCCRSVSIWRSRCSPWRT